MSQHHRRAAWGAVDARLVGGYLADSALPVVLLLAAAVLLAAGGRAGQWAPIFACLGAVWETRREARTVERRVSHLENGTSPLLVKGVPTSADSSGVVR